MGGLELVERFFKLTLDNVYRFTCSVLFVVALVAWGRGQFTSSIEQLAHSPSGSPGILSPVAQLAELLNWLAIPSAWLAPVDDWLAERQNVAGVVAILVLTVAVAFAAANSWHSRSGSTALLSIVILIQVEQFARVLSAAAIAYACLILITGLAIFLALRRDWGFPVWLTAAWQKSGNVAATLALAAAYVFSPLGWLISQEPSNLRGTRWNPLYIAHLERH